MAKQTGLVQISGSIDNLSFFKGKDGYQVRKKTGVSASRLANDPAFRRTRENMAEFSSAAKTSKLFRTALRDAAAVASDGKIVARLNAKFLEAIRLDSTNPRGQRNIIDGEATVLRGFEFNSNVAFNTVFQSQFDAVINRTTGICLFKADAYVPETSIGYIKDATHYRLVLVVAAIDFEQKRYVTGKSVTVYLPMNSNVLTDPFELDAELPPNNTNPIFMAIAIEFASLSNDGKYYALDNGAFNTCTIVDVNTPV